MIFATDSLTKCQIRCRTRRPRTSRHCLFSHKMRCPQRTGLARMCTKPKRQPTQSICLCTPPGRNILFRGLKSCAHWRIVQFVVTSLSLHLNDLKAMVQQLRSCVLHIHESVRAGPDIPARESADREIGIGAEASNYTWPPGLGTCHTAFKDLL